MQQIAQFNCSSKATHKRRPLQSISDGAREWEFKQGRKTRGEASQALLNPSRKMERKAVQLFFLIITVLVLTSLVPSPHLIQTVEGFSLSLSVQGSEIAVDREFPFMASLQYSTTNNPRHRCGATIIGSRWLLTASHCVVIDGATVPPTTITILTGSNKLSGCSMGDLMGSATMVRNSNCIRARAKRIISHENYDSSRIINDIALIELYDDLPFGSALQPIRLALIRPSYNTPHKVAGWGYYDSTRTVSNVLRKGSLPIVQDSYCNAMYLGMSTIRGQVCAGAGEGVDTCAGDSGGPLFFHQGNSWVQLGLTSYGPDKCGVPESYTNRGVYTSVEFFGDWIMRKTNITAEGNVTRVDNIFTEAAYGHASSAGLSCIALILPVLLLVFVHLIQ